MANSPVPAKNFRTEIEAFINTNLSPAARSHALANFARSERDALIQSGDASQQYVTRVDGRIDPIEDHVRGDGGGIINYRFSFLGDAAEFAMSFLQMRVTKVSGRLSESFWLSIDDRYTPPGVAFDYRTIKPTSKVVIGNAASYWRKADMNMIGSKTLRYRNPAVLADCATALLRQFGNTAISARRVYDYQFPDRYRPVLSPTRKPFNYNSPVLVITEIR